MIDRAARDRLIIKLFYTACCLLTDIVVLLMALAGRDPAEWTPSVGAVATVWMISLVVLVSIWGSLLVSRRPRSPPGPLRAIRAVFNFAAALGATLLLWLLLTQPITLMFRSGDPYRRWALLVA